MKHLKKLYSWPWELFFFISIVFWKLGHFSVITNDLFGNAKVFTFLYKALSASLNGDWTLWTKGLAWMNVSTVIILSAWTLWMNRKARIWILLSLNLLVSFIMLADTIYFRYFGDFITVPVLLQTGQVSELGGSISALFQFNDIYFFFDIPFWLLAGGWLIWQAIQTKRLKRKSHVEMHTETTPSPSLKWHQKIRTYAYWKKQIPATIAIVFLYLFAISGVNAAIDRGMASGLLSSNWWNVSVYSVLGIVGFHTYDTGSFLKMKFRDVPPWTDEEKATAQNILSKHAKERMEKTAYFGTMKNKNILVIQVEALQTFLIGKSVNGQPITPNFDELIKKSAFFPNFAHQAAQGRTSDADFVTNCSQYPFTTGSVMIRAADSRFHCMPAVLKEHGYSNSVFHAFQASFWNRNIFYPVMGWDRFYSIDDFTMDEKAGWSLSDRSLFKQSIAKIKEFKQPFYSMFITLSTHHPYKLQSTFKKFDEGEFKGTILGDYIQSVHYFDSTLQTLMDELKSANLWDNTIVVFYGDHDSSIPDLKDIEKLTGQPFNEATKRYYWRGVPLIMHFPNDQFSGTYDQIGGQMDIAPTLTHLLGLDTNQLAWFGQNLFAKEHHGVATRTGEVFNRDRIYLPSPDRQISNGKCISFDLGEPMPIDQCKTMVEERTADIKLSDDLIMNRRLAKPNE